MQQGPQRCGPFSFLVSGSRWGHGRVHGNHVAACHHFLDQPVAGAQVDLQLDAADVQKLVDDLMPMFGWSANSALALAFFAASSPKA
jgi:hypothetical protein